jgi:dolichol-phosphate mannosyltransferase
LSRRDLQILSVIIPARDEEGVIVQTIENLYQELHNHQIACEILVVDDGSRDRTYLLAKELESRISEVKVLQTPKPFAFGRAISFGLKKFKGDAVVVMMADGSDSATDVVHYWQWLQMGYDCVFGSRFIKGSLVVDYPILKLILNRIANAFIRVAFCHGLNDTTNAFKAYRAEVINGINPITSEHFNITVELPLRSISKGYSYKIIPISWKNRRAGISKLKIKEMGSRYFMVCFKIWIEKFYFNKINKKTVKLKVKN